MKKALGILLASAMLITTLAGCNNSKAKTVAKVNDIEIDSEELRILLDMYFLNYSFEYNPETAEEQEKQFAESQRDDAIDDLIYEKVHLIKAREDGLDTLNDEEKESIEGQVKAFKDQWYQIITEQVSGEGVLTGEEAADEVKKRYNEYMASKGFTDEYVRERYTNFMILGKVQDKYAETIQPSDEQLKAEYQTRVGEEKERYTENPGFYIDDSTSTQPIYRPANCKRVTHILVGLPDAVSQEIYSLKLSGDTEGISALLDEELPKIKPAADEVYARLQEEGANFEEIREEVTADKSGDEVNQPEGFIINTGTSSFVEEFVEAGMKLENVGEYSEPVASDYGYHIIRLEEILPEETTAFEALDETLLSEFKTYVVNDEYEKLFESWKNEMTIEIFPENVVFPTPEPTETPTASDGSSPTGSDGTINDLDITSAPDSDTDAATPESSSAEEETPEATPSESAPAETASPTAE